MYDITTDFNSIKERYLKIANGEIPTDINEVIIKESKINICDLLLKIGFSSSKSEAKRMVQGKGVKVNFKVIEDINKVILYKEITL